MKKIICYFFGHRWGETYWYWEEITQTTGEHIGRERVVWRECERCDEGMSRITNN